MATPDQTNREKEIFEAALDRAPGEERRLYLEAACGDDAGLLARLHSLLRAHEAGEYFLPELPKEASKIITEKPGDKIGRFRLLQRIGEGGCGVVYMAEQEEPVRRKVALKIVKLGMDTRQVVARFEAERQALALMDHPNIAKVLDAGATEAGRPYFVMELVGGIKITDYCEQNQLDTRQRLDLFIQVCRAVQHAHQKGVIHRDIKPSNILVATQDGVPVPKVIDFGIAKATQGRLTDDTVFTAFEQFLGTPAYMSPEQTQVGGLDVDTRSDIYSLGVLLYELLTGKTPFDAKELLAAGLEAMRRTIQEKEPPTPSTRLAQEPLATRVATRGKSEIVNRKSEIDKDLDWIVMKCLEKDRARRYETANGLARDIERHLSNEPVAASPPSKLYRFQKLVRRNKVTATATAVVAVVLVLGVSVSTWQAWRATRAERRSARDAAKSEQVAKFLTEMLQGVDPSVAMGRDTTLLREILDKTVERVGKELTNQPQVEFDIRYILANMYDELGLFRQAEKLARENLTLARSRLGGESAEVAEALHSLGRAQWRLGNHDEAEKLLREAVAMQRKLSGDENLKTASAINGLGVLLCERGKYAEAEELLRHALELDRKLLGNEHEEVAEPLNNLAGVLKGQGKLAEAETMHRQVLAMLRKLHRNEHPKVAFALHQLGAALLDRGKDDEAEPLFRQSLAMLRKLAGNEHPLSTVTLTALGNIQERQGKLPEAESSHRQALALRCKLGGNGHPSVAESVTLLAGVLEKEGKFDEVETLFRDQLPGLRAGLPQSPHLANALVAFTSTLLLEKKFAEAEPIARECLIIREQKIPDNWRTFNIKSMLGGSLLGQKKYGEAEPFLLAGYEGLKQREDKVPATGKSNVKEALQRLVKLYELTGRIDKVAEWKAELAEWYRKEAALFRAAADAGDVQAQNGIAWLLATCEESAMRDGPGAVAYAEKAVEATNRKDPATIGTLAAAYAEVGEFAKAISVQKEAITLAQDGPLKESLAARLRLYESNTPYRDR